MENPGDERWMRAALVLARRAEGRTRPNPAVGCVIVKDGRLIGSGATADGGRPHAEVVALKDCNDAKGAGVFVTLEPCSHTGKTPPCADALIAAGVKRVVIGAVDPDSRVAGSGVAALRDAGIEVAHALEDEAREFYAGYANHREHGLPRVTVKLATSLDGKIALNDGRSKWITSDASRRFVHEMRSRHDAVMTSAATLTADDATLTHRLSGYDGPQPLRVVVSGGLAIDAKSNLATTTDKGEVLHLHSGDAPRVKGIIAEKIPAAANGKPDLAAVMAALGARGITSVLVEAGGKFCAGLMAAGLVSRLVWMRSPGVIGDDGVASLGALGLDAIEDGRVFRRIALYSIDRDTVEILEKTEG